MKISILMPTYDCPPELLEKSIQSVFDQTYQNIELILKDGNISNPAISAPTIKSLLDSLGAKVKYILSPEGHLPKEKGTLGHNGFYWALNECVKAATGEILSMLPADDERGDIETLAYVNGEFENHGSSPFLLYGINEFMDRESRHIQNWQSPVIPITYQDLLNEYTLSPPAMFWNRAVHDKFGLFNTECEWAGDYEFWLRCWRGIDSKFVPRVLGRYRRWELSQNTSNLKLIECEINKMRKAYGAK